MFAPRYFAPRSFAPRYFAPGSDVAVDVPVVRPAGAGGGWGTIGSYGQRSPVPRPRAFVLRRKQLRESLNRFTPADLQARPSLLIDRARRLERELDYVVDQNVLLSEDMILRYGQVAEALRTELDAELDLLIAQEDDELIALLAAYLTVENKQEDPIRVVFD